MIGKKISQLRKRKGLSLTELADRAGIAKSNLSNIERNLNQNPSLNVLEKIASALHVELSELLDTETKIEFKKQRPDKNWTAFVRELKESGIEKEQLEEYKNLLEFIKWKNRKGK